MRWRNITARGFKQKLKSPMNSITRHSVFGETRYWLGILLNVEHGVWPHARILIWLVDKVRSEV